MAGIAVQRKRSAIRGVKKDDKPFKLTAPKRKKKSKERKKKEVLQMLLEDQAEEGQNSSLSKRKKRKLIKKELKGQLITSSVSYVKGGDWGAGRK